MTWKAACLGLVLLARAGEAAECKANPADETAVVETMRAMYAAATADDLGAFQRLILPGFYAFDGGQRFDGDALMRFVMDLHAKGSIYVWTVADPDVHVDCDGAWIAYVNRGSVKRGDTPPVPTTWIESAVLRRVSGVWKLTFFHSTRAPAPPT